MPEAQTITISDGTGTGNVSISPARPTCPGCGGAVCPCCGRPIGAAPAPEPPSIPGPYIPVPIYPSPQPWQRWPWLEPYVWCGGSDDVRVTFTC